VKILVYGNDHGRPHFHALHAEHNVVVDIETMEVIVGRMPSNKLRKVIEWATPRQEQLLEASRLVRSGIKPRRIP